MKGKHHIVLETGRVRYEFEIRRNITVIQGDSATGKTSLLDLLRLYSVRGSQSGITLQSDVPCIAYGGTGDDWQQSIEGIGGSIVFIDEDYSFVASREFASCIRGTDNYYVLITRKPLINLPYSIREIYGIRTSGKYHFPEKVYNEFYPIYGEAEEADGTGKTLVLTEDSRAGFQFYEKICGTGRVISVDGNAGIYQKLLELGAGNRVLVIADGAAFGAFIAKLLSLAGVMNHASLYFPESFEWLILKSGLLTDNQLEEILQAPEAYIDSSEYFSWERFFAALLESKSAGAGYGKQYHKEKLASYYLSGTSINRVLQVIPEEIRKDLVT